MMSRRPTSLSRSRRSVPTPHDRIPYPRQIRETAGYRTGGEERACAPPALLDRKRVRTLHFLWKYTSATVSWPSTTEAGADARPTPSSSLIRYFGLVAVTS